MLSVMLAEKKERRNIRKGLVQHQEAIQRYFNVRLDLRDRTAYRQLGAHRAWLKLEAWRARLAI